MTINTNYPNSSSLENPFADLSSLKNVVKLDEREEGILSNCKYGELQKKWSEGLDKISNNPHRDVHDAKESCFCHLGNILGFANSEPLKEVHTVFSNFDLFDRYVRNDIPPGTYKKIAKANPAYFDKVIKHLEDCAKKLDIKAEARVDTFCSSSTGYALARAATRFRDTADYLKRMMNGDDAAKPENNNANPGANREQPTIINHYHNNIQFGNNYNNYGHIGNNNFYNKGGNMAVMFKESSNSVPNTSFRPEYSVSKSEHSFYSPTINGIKFLDVTTENALKILGQDKSEENENDAGRVNAGIHKKTDNDEQNVEEDKTMRNLEFHIKKPTRLRNLYTKFFENWDTIREEIEKQENKTPQAQSNQDPKSINNLHVFESHPIAKGGKITPANILKELESLNDEVNNFVPKGNGIEKEGKYNAKEMLLRIQQVMSQDKKTSEDMIIDKRKNNIDKREKNKVLTHDNAPQNHGIPLSFTDQKHIDNARIQYKEDGLEGLLKETWEIIKDIRSELKQKKN